MGRISGRQGIVVLGRWATAPSPLDSTERKPPIGACAYVCVCVCARDLARRQGSCLREIGQRVRVETNYRGPHRQHGKRAATHRAAHHPRRSHSFNPRSKNNGRTCVRRWNPTGRGAQNMSEPGPILPGCSIYNMRNATWMRRLSTMPPSRHGTAPADRSSPSARVNSSIPGWVLQRGVCVRPIPSDPVHGLRCHGPTCARVVCTCCVHVGNPACLRDGAFLEHACLHVAYCCP